MPSPSIFRLSDRDSFARATARAVARALFAALTRRAEAVIAVPGGSTAKTVLPVLFAEFLPWDRICITLVDERWVPLGHPDSNETLLRSLVAGPAEKATLIGLYDGSLSPEAAVPKLAIQRSMPNVVLLGMGEDGHIASLFPHQPANQAVNAFAAVRWTDHPRITLTPPVFAQAEICILAFMGATKQIIFKRALSDGPDDELPVRHALRTGAQVFIGP